MTVGPLWFRPPTFGFSLGSWVQPARCHICAGERTKGRSVAQGCLPPAGGHLHLHPYLPSQAERTVFVVPSAFEPGKLPGILYSAAHLLDAVCRTFLAVFVLALWALLGKRAPGRATPLGQALWGLGSVVYPGVLLPLGCFAQSQPCALDWRPWRDRKGRLSQWRTPLHGQHSRSFSRSLGSISSMCWFAPHFLTVSR